jgi:putative hemolysin
LIFVHAPLTETPRLLSKLLARPVPRPAAWALDRAFGIGRIEALYGALRGAAPEVPLWNKLLLRLEIVHRVAEKDLEQIPRKGAAILVANHPFGILEGAVLAAVLRAVRPDVKFLANEILCAIPEIRDLLIPVDPIAREGGAPENASGLRKALEFLSQGGLLVVFPAGEVSHFQLRERAIADPPWSRSIARLAAIASRRAANLSVIPARIEGSNSALFQTLGMLHPRLRTAMLARELLNKRGKKVAIRIGSPIPIAKLLAIPGDKERTDYLRWRADLLAAREEYKPRTALPLFRPRTPAQAEIAPAVAPETLESEVQALAPAALLARSGDLAAYLSRAEEIPNVLAELGRLREVTFRAAGEGTGRATDIDDFDPHYLHLFVWSAARREVAGAYRIAATETVRERFGLGGLYTATLFDYQDEFLDRMGPALELGRSFIRAEYQKSFAPLLLLWKGIGSYVARNPRYKTLFGPVSISNQYRTVSRELMVSFLERYAGLPVWAGLVSSRNPAGRSTRFGGLPEAGVKDIEDLSDVVSDIEPSRAGVPVLLRQYLKLGGKLLGFNVDPKFANALDGLILVDLTKTEPKLLERYLGRSEAARFLAHWKENDGTH